MNRYVFTFDTRQFNVLATSLSEAVAMLPPELKHSPVSLQVRVEPVESEAAYWKARAMELESQLHGVLRQ